MTTASAPDSRHTVRLLEADDDFARAVPSDDRALADRALTVRTRTFDTEDVVACDPQEAIALLVLEGAVWREISVGTGGAPQLLGLGSVVLCEPPAGELLQIEAVSTALQHTRCALLDRRFLMAATRWPQLTMVLHHRLAVQERDLATLAAIGQLPRVDARLTALLWHLAERWGRIGSDGVHLPLRLTHATLGRFVGARRPTVSLALAELRDAGTAVRREDGTWMLHGSPPELVLQTPGLHTTPPLDLLPAKGTKAA